MLALAAQPLSSRFVRQRSVTLVARMPADNEAWVRALGLPGAGAQPALEELRRLLVQGLRRTLASRGVAVDACEDFAQEALLKIQQQLPTFRGESRFTTWAFAIAVRVAFDELRHKRWADISFDAASADARRPVAFEAPKASATQERQVLREGVLSALQGVIERELTDKQRAVLMAELQGMPHAEMASALGMNRNALYKLAHDARKRARAHLEAAGFSPEDALGVFE